MATITISREYGSGGDEIAIRVCEKLGYRYFDKTLMAQVVAEAGLSTTEIVDYTGDNYKVRSFLDRLLARGGQREIGRVEKWTEDPSGARTKVMTILSEAEGVALVQAAVRAVSKQGNVVIVGRGGQVILQGMPDVLHVRVEAPMDTRLSAYCWVGERPPLWLEERILEHDQAAAEYLKHFYGVDWADPMLYDLVINTRQLSVDAAAQLIVAAAQHLPAPELQPEALSQQA